MRLTRTQKGTKPSKVEDQILDAIYQYGSDDIKECYEIHVNLVNGSWIIDCEPLVNDVPVIKLVAFTSKSGNKEKLKINPKKLAKFPQAISFSNYNTCIDLANRYMSIMDFIISLYDFEFEL